MSLEAKFITYKRVIMNHVALILNGLNKEHVKIVRKQAGRQTEWFIYIQPAC